MTGFNRLTSAFHGWSCSETRGASKVRRSPKIRPALETLESIDLLSTFHGHAMTDHRAASAREAAKSAGIQSILPLNYGVTGVRQDVGGNVVITGGTGPPSLNDNDPAFIYYGPLSQIPSTTSASSLYTFNPTFAGEAVSSSQFYGPNTSLFNPSIGAGNITAVGAYRYSGYNYQAGMLYTGPPDGSGEPSSRSSPPAMELMRSATPFPTAPWATSSSAISTIRAMKPEVNGFIYNISSKSYTTVDIGHLQHDPVRRLARWGPIQQPVHDRRGFLG